MIHYLQQRDDHVPYTCVRCGGRVRNLARGFCSRCIQPHNPAGAWAGRHSYLSGKRRHPRENN